MRCVAWGGRVDYSVCSGNAGSQSLLLLETLLILSIYNADFSWWPSLLPYLCAGVPFTLPFVPFVADPSASPVEAAAGVVACVTLRPFGHYEEHVKDQK